MLQQTGIHFYINIVNFNEIIRDEESKTNQVTHAIHALDTFFSSVEAYGKKVSEDLVVEKITGARLHMYVIGDLTAAYQNVIAVSSYAYRLAGWINRDIPKYRTLLDFKINVGAAFGKFYEFEFDTDDGYSELTTIGYCANYAAKLQALSRDNCISVSEDVYKALGDDDRRYFNLVYDKSIHKYGQDKYYTESLSIVSKDEMIGEKELVAIKNYANSVNLQDIEYSDVRKRLNFSNLGKTQCKRIEGIPVFADVRGFTSQFNEDDSNLAEMSQKTRNILESMYHIILESGGAHVQFQGDREMSLFHNIPSHNVHGMKQKEATCFEAAILASMRMVDAVKPYSVHIGVGEDYGKMFATKIGARGEKDNILLGDTVIEADKMEDENAGEDEIAITREVYKGLKNERSHLIGKFHWQGNCYIANIGYREYLQEESFRYEKKNTAYNTYNGAWKNDEK